MPSPRFEAVKRFYDAFNARDLPGMLVATDPEIELHSRYAQAGGTVVHGHDEIRIWLADLADAWDRLDVELERAEDDDEGRTTALARLHGRGRHSGLVIDEAVAHRIDWREGKVRRLVYVDRAEAERFVRNAAAGGITTATFDCYGTLIDWEAGLGAFLYELSRRHGDRAPGSGRQLRERWEEIQFEEIQGPYRPYREILGDSLARWAAERHYRVSEKDAQALVREMESWQPFPDTVPALRRAKEAGLRLVIVSNTDHAIMEHTLRQLEVEFDGLVLAEDCRAYKPSAAVFEQVHRDLREDPARVLHVAFGFKYDLPPAQRLGFRTAWVNRKGEPRPEGASPDYEWDSLWPLADVTVP